MRLDRFACALMFAALLASLASTGCDAQRPKSAVRMSSQNSATGLEMERVDALVAADQSPMSPDASAPAPADATARQLVRRAAMEMVVGDVTRTVRRAQALADSSGGYVSNLECGGSTQAASASLILRVPANRLDATMESLRALAVQVRRETSSLEDVTPQAVDLEARLRTLRATETELLSVLTDVRRRGGKVEGIMAVFHELTGIRTQIEQLQGRRDELSKQAALSFLSLSLVSEHSDQPPAPATWHAGDTVQSSVRSLVGMLRGLTDAAIFLVITVAPIALILGAPVVAILAWRRRRMALRGAGAAGTGS